ncbi:succinate dehydrogenase, hydrophobic membrane anchor protein [Zoogloea sp.]|uniref:succinate dehydrogenase, hydrophobic membrane anchor protein n=1 Tax=Zoogloea sp. TaxID=49181 RepID=UPI0035B46F27|nr:succinate dehydrogenase, hydrophobic membrane anchor protein [Rhodocyclales bacterium]
MVKPIIVGAHYGFRDWLAQRVTAVVMAVYTVIFAIAALTTLDGSYESWRALFSGGFMKFATFLFFLSLFYHAWIGVRDIFMDYIKPVGLRLTLHSVVVLLLVGYAGWAVQILWRL